MQGISAFGGDLREHHLASFVVPFFLGQFAQGDGFPWFKIFIKAMILG